MLYLRKVFIKAYHVDQTKRNNTGKYFGAMASFYSWFLMELYHTYFVLKMLMRDKLNSFNILEIIDWSTCWLD